MNLFSQFQGILDKLRVLLVSSRVKPEQSGGFPYNRSLSSLKTYTLEQFLSDPNADVGTGLIVSRGNGYCFTVKSEERWGKTQEGFPLLPFGGIGGKLEQGELPAASLYRETMEEVGSGVRIVENQGQVILMDSNSIQKILLTTHLANEPLPRIIFRSPKAEAGRKAFTNVLIYQGEFTSSELTPLDDPAIIEVDAKLLRQMVIASIPLKAFHETGGKISSRIVLPEDGVLFPVGTAIAIARCLASGLIE